MLWQGRRFKKNLHGQPNFISGNGWFVVKVQGLVSEIDPYEKDLTCLTMDSA